MTATHSLFVQNDRPNFGIIQTEYMTFPNWTMFNCVDKPKSCVLCLPGRGLHAADLAEVWKKACLHETLIIGVTPKKYCWYPMPYAANDQTEAVQGLPIARKEIERVLSKITNDFSIPREKIAICGFSAGGVMANYVGIHSQSPLAGVACFAGAILEPKKVPPCKNKSTPYLLTHACDDTSFDWEERYLPMRNALIRNKYPLYAAESSWGGHVVNVSDVLLAAYLFSENLGYPDSWREEYSFFRDYDFTVSEYNI